MLFQFLVEMYNWWDCKLVLYLFLVQLLCCSVCANNLLEILLKELSRIRNDAIQENMRRSNGAETNAGNLYERHIKKLREVNGLKKHNFQDKNVGSANIYINNPIEARLPHPYLSLREFKNALLDRAMKHKAKIFVTRQPKKAKTNFMPSIRNGHYLNKNFKSPVVYLKNRQKNINMRTKRNKTRKRKADTTMIDNNNHMKPALRESNNTSTELKKVTLTEVKPKPKKRIIKIKIGGVTKSKPNTLATPVNDQTESPQKYVPIKKNICTISELTSLESSSVSDIPISNWTTNYSTPLFRGSLYSYLSNSSFPVELRSSDNASQPLSSLTSTLFSSSESPASTLQIILNGTAAPSNKTTKYLVMEKEPSNISISSSDSLKPTFRGSESSISLSTGLSASDNVLQTLSSSTKTLSSLRELSNSSNSTIDSTKPTLRGSKSNSSSSIALSSRDNALQPLFSSRKTLSSSTEPPITISEPIFNGTADFNNTHEPTVPEKEPRNFSISSQNDLKHTLSGLKSSYSPNSSLSAKSDSHTLGFSNINLQPSSSSMSSSLGPPTSMEKPLSDGTYTADRNESASLTTKKRILSKYQTPNMFMGFNPRLRLTKPSSTMRITISTTKRKPLGRPAVYMGGGI